VSVSRSGYYHDQKSQKRKISDPEHEKILKSVREIAIASSYSYGRRRIRKALEALRYAISNHKGKKTDERSRSSRSTQEEIQSENRQKSQTAGL